MYQYENKRTQFEISLNFTNDFNQINKLQTFWQTIPRNNIPCCHKNCCLVAGWRRRSYYSAVISRYVFE